MIPMYMRLKAIERKDGVTKGVNLWLPLFLIWILLLPVILLVFLAWVTLRVLGLGSPGARSAARFIEAAVDVLSEINGLEIDIRSRESRFILHF